MDIWRYSRVNVRLRHCISSIGQRPNFSCAHRFWVYYWKMFPILRRTLYIHTHFIKIDVLSSRISIDNAPDFVYKNLVLTEPPRNVLILFPNYTNRGEKINKSLNVTNESFKSAEVSFWVSQNWWSEDVQSRMNRTKKYLQKTSFICSNKI